ncbi:MAG: flagellar biosynthetic protein FliR [Alphaproteobacteria bacterium]|nr:flagellar biosynthetic protein FliR [Alphaproteobacteria bacterium]
MTELQQLLPADILTFMLVFSRVGAMVMTLPALGELSIPARARLSLALGLTLIMAPVVGGLYPANISATIPSLAGIVLSEVITGLAIGLLLRMVMGSVQVAGNVIATQTGLAFAQGVDPTQGVQGALISMFLSLLAITLIFMSDLHHLLIAGIEHSFHLFPPGKIPVVGDFAKLATGTMSGMYMVGIQMSAPFIVFGLIVYGAAGVVARMMPQLQIFFLVTPLNILAGFVILALTLSTMMMLFLDEFTSKAQLFVPH